MEAMLQLMINYHIDTHHGYETYVTCNTLQLLAALQFMDASIGLEALVVGKRAV